jgi:2-oxoglutarate ferredoxin oxidoreductase subunit beta
VKACAFALGCGARFVARAVDTDQAYLPQILKRAHAHQGTSFVEIFQNCIVYNDGVFADFTDREVAPTRQLRLEHGKPLLYGENREKGLRLRPGTLTLEIVTVGENGVTEADVLVHDETNLTLASLLARMDSPAFPVALGVLYCDPAPSFDAAMTAQMETAKSASPKPDIDKLLRLGATWTIGER